MEGDRQSVGGVGQAVGRSVVLELSISPGPVDEGLTALAAGRCDPTDQNLMITAGQHLLEGAVEPAEAAVDHRDTGLLAIGPHSMEAFRLRPPTASSKMGGDVSLSTGQHADGERPS